MRYSTKSLKCSVYFILTAQLNLDKPQFQVVNSNIWLVITKLDRPTAGLFLQAYNKRIEWQKADIQAWT